MAAPPPHVAILGGGVAGMSAAHELAERGLRVTVYEKNPALPGGKARSVPVPGSAVGGRGPLPGEHGFRFFPGFYRHVTDTMRRIPFAGNERGVLDNLVPVDRIMLARMGKAPVVTLARFPRSLDDVRVLIAALFESDLELEPGERDFFASRLWQIMTSCQDRRFGEYERVGWWQFVDAERRSPAYQAVLGEGLTRTLVAAKAREASTKTGGDILVQLLATMADPGTHVDRVLNAPTNEAWLTPWLDHLRALGVDYRLGHALERFECDADRVVGAWVRDDRGALTRVTADVYVAAVPVEVAARALRTEFEAVHGTADEGEVRRMTRSIQRGHPAPDLSRSRDGSGVAPTVLTLDPSLASVLELAHSVAWMNGLQIYLDERVDVNAGHVIYADSPWALTSISQPQFWRDYDLSAVGDGRVRDVLSVDISDWDRPGVLSGRPAREAETKEEIFRDVWEQLKRSVNVGGRTLLRDDQLNGSCPWYLDGSIEFLHHPELLLEPQAFLGAGSRAGLSNAEPLLVNEVHTWTLRPDAHTAIPNLFLASDYVRTNTDLATMEGANEAARRAVNGVLEATGSRAPACDVWPMHEPLVLALLRQADRRRYARGLPWRDPLRGWRRLAHPALTAVADWRGRHAVP